MTTMRDDFIETKHVGMTSNNLSIRCYMLTHRRLLIPYCQAGPVWYSIH